MRQIWLIMSAKNERGSALYQKQVRSVAFAVKSTVAIGGLVGVVGRQPEVVEDFVSFAE